MPTITIRLKLTAEQAEVWRDRVPLAVPVSQDELKELVRRADFAHEYLTLAADTLPQAAEVIGALADTSEKAEWLAKMGEQARAGVMCLDFIRMVIGRGCLALPSESTAGGRVQ